MRIALLNAESGRVRADGHPRRNQRLLAGLNPACIFRRRDVISRAQRERDRQPGREALLILKCLGSGSGEHVGFAVQRRDEAVDTLAPQDGSEFGTAGRHLADCTVEVDVGNQPSLAAAPHRIVDPDRLAIGLDGRSREFCRGEGRFETDRLIAGRRPLIGSTR